MPADPRDPPAFSLSQFEWLVHRRQHEAAGRLLLLGLRRLDERHGALPAGLSEDARAHFLARWAAAIGALFADPGFQVSRDGFEQFLTLQRWLAAIFGATPFGHADHVIAALAGAMPGQGGALALSPGDLLKYCVLCVPDSELDVPLDALWAHDARAAVGLCIARLAARQMVTPSACARRETMLRWLPRKLAQLPDLRGLPTAVLHDACMHCSYALAADKHDIKREINRLLRQRLLADGLDDMRAHPPRRARPLMLVVLEAFSAPHSLYRTHSSTLRAARARFELHGVAMSGAVDAVARTVFDRCHSLSPPDAVAQAVALARELRPDIIYYPSIGLSPLAVPLSNLRLAPLQLAAAGHPATTHAPGIDAMLVEEDTLGDASCFSERVVTLPRDCVVHVPPPGFQARPASPGVESPHPDPERPLRVAVCATSLKLNARFLATCRRIGERASRAVQFHFFVGDCRGVAHAALRRTVTAAVPQAHVHESMPYEDYLARLRGCDLFLDPFPYGNTNGIVDTVSQGLPGVCMTGREVHERLDAALFRRLRLPEWLIAADAGQYERAAIGLIDDARGRAALTAMILGNGGADALFQGRPERFGLIVEHLLAQARSAVPDIPR